MRYTSRELLCGLCMAGVIVVTLTWPELLHVEIGAFWLVPYLASVVVILRVVIRKDPFHPVVVLPLAYVAVLGLGASVLVDLTRGVQYGTYEGNLIGLGFLSMLLGVVTVPANVKVERRVIPEEASPARGRPLLIAVIVCGMLAGLALFARLGVIPMLASDVNDAKSRLFAGAGILNVLVYGASVATCGLFCDGVQRNSRQVKRFAHLLAACLFVLLILTGYRARTLLFVFTYVGIGAFVYRHRIRVPYMLAGVGVTALFLGTIGAYRRGPVDLPAISRELAVIAVTRPVTVARIVGAVSEQEELHGKRYLAGVRKLLPGEQTGANVDLKYLIYPNVEAMPDAAGVTPSIVGEAYLNYGWYGVAPVMFMVGWMLARLYAWTRRKPTMARTVAYLVTLVGCAGAISSGLGNKMTHLLLQYVWIVVIAMCYRLRASARSGGLVLKKSGEVLQPGGGRQT